MRYLLVVTAGREEAAREALQQTWLRSVRHMRGFSTEAALWSWLTLLARSSLVDERRKQGRFLRFLERWRRFGTSAPPEDDERELESDARLLRLLETEVSGLTSEGRRLIEGKYLEHRSTRELAGWSGTTEKAIESRLARLRNKIKSAVLVRLQREPHDEAE